MNARTFKIRYVGGPLDGLVVTDSCLRVETTRRMPPNPAVVRCTGTRCFELVGFWCTVYRLTSQKATFENGHTPITLRYDFVGYELLKTSRQRDGRPVAGSRRLTAVREWLRSIPGKLAKWMLEPVDHPLQLPGAGRVSVEPERVRQA
jgi:hypothetical protein